MANSFQQRLSQECQWFLLAVQFFTRIPVGLLLPFKPSDLNRTSRYISIVGLIVATIAGLAYGMGYLLYGPWLAALLALASAVLATGAFHEDGLADAADGFGGGLTRAQILLIMKDSRIGTYGTVATFLSLTAKVVLLAQLSLPQGILAIALQHMLSRTLAVSLMLKLPYVQEDASSKVKPVAKQLLTQDIVLAGCIALLPCLLLTLTEAIVLLSSLLILRWLAIVYLSKRLGGYTGDCLGAVQQLMELMVLFVVVAFWTSL